LPLQRLAQLYRERDGNLKTLVADFEKRAADPTPDQWSAGVVLGAVYQQDGRPDEAKRAYENARAARPKNAVPLLALARLALDQKDLATARARYEEALPSLPTQEREQTVRALMLIALDLKDFEGAGGYHRDLAKSSQGSPFVRGELGRELAARGELERAETELRDVVTACGGDNRTLAPALRDLGAVLAKQHKNADALAVFKKALAAAGGEAGVRGEILALVTDVYRSQSNLPELIELIEKERPGDSQRLAMLAALYEETGEVDKAIGAYRHVLATGKKSVDLRLKVIHLLQAQGELEQATHEYEALVRAAPHNPDFVFDLCETLIQRGERPRALGLLRQLEQRANADEETLARVADFYERVDERPKAIAVLTRLSTIAPGDPTHLVDLGDRYFQQGDKKRAMEIWARVKTIVPSRAKALATLGDVFLDHDLPKEALESLKEAVQIEPQKTEYRKAYAVALERTATAMGAAASTARLEEARGIWESILAASHDDKSLAREARTHIVTLWALLHRLDHQIEPLKRRFGAQPPELEAGRLLSDVQVRLRKLSDAEATLRHLTELAPGDADAFLGLERVLVLEGNLGGAIRALEKLVEIEPKRAREFYQRMAQYAAELYRDDDAITFAARAVQLSPDDAEGHKKLGEMYRKKQDTVRAITELRAAIAKNDKLYPVYFELAELLLSRGEVDEADRLLRRVVRGAPDDELVSQAARQSMQANLGRGKLELLEQDLLPAALGNPRKPIYRRLLVELYGAMAFPLIQEARHGLEGRADSARRALRAIGERAIKPLLDALADDSEAQQRVAVDLLAFVENKGAGSALFAFATSLSDQPLRIRAMLAAGALRDPELLPKYEALLLPKDDGTIAPGDPISVAAAWGVAHLSDRRAEPLLSLLVAKTTPEVRALAAIGLGFLHSKKSVVELSKLAGADDAGNLARAAAAFALGELSAKDAGPTLIALAQGPDVLPRQAAILALARLGLEPAPNAIAEGLLDADPAVRETSMLAALVFDTRQYRSPKDPLIVPDGAVDVRAVLSGLVPRGYAPAERAAALIGIGAALRRAAVAAAQTSQERSRVLGDALLARGNRPAFAPFTDGLDDLDPALREKAEAVAESITAAVVPAFASLARHPATDLRIRAVQLLATRTENQALAAVIDALSDPDDAVQRAALAAVTPGPNEAVVRAVAGVLLASRSWPVRMGAAEALGRSGASAANAKNALATAARTDRYALVRESAMKALRQADPKTAVAVLRDASEHDPEPHLRSLARELLKEMTP
jgi:cellulose synthase operon protein C